MTTKSDIDKILLEKFPNERFVAVWWKSPLPGLGKQTPTQVYEQDEARLLEYVRGY